MDTQWTEDYIKSDIFNAVNAVLLKFGDTNSRLNKLDLLEQLLSKLRTKAKKIKDRTRGLEDIDLRLQTLNGKITILDKIDSKTDRANQKVETMSINLSNTDFSDKTLDERMILFADDIVLRLGRIEGQDYTEQ